MGGYIALSFLKQYPEQVDGLILSNTQSIADNDETKNKRELSAIEVLEHGSTNFVNGFLLKALSFDAPEPTKELVRSIAESQLPRGIASALRGMALRYDTSTLLTSTQLPILIITGTKDMLISPQQSENMHALAPKSRLVSILDAGHLSNLEQPEQWNQAVIEMFGTMNTL
jgi:pimeloyl-ACP methyl ester carboxylesterase